MTIKPAAMSLFLVMLLKARIIYKLRSNKNPTPEKIMWFDGYMKKNANESKRGVMYFFADITSSFLRRQKETINGMRKIYEK